MGKLFVTGFGPGNPENMTYACRQALEAAEVIVGYSGYVDLVKPLYPSKTYMDTPMMGEVERCKEALAQAAAGFTVAVVCSGDSGIYGMASLIYELSETAAPGNEAVEIIVVPGITAAASGGALLGAPLSHDFVTISLSDLLTPWELIEKRLAAAAAGDFVLCIYNPGSIKRHDYLQKACDILLQQKAPDTVCGCVKNIGRSGEEAFVTSLAQLRNTKVDMFTTVFIGNSRTREIGGKMVTPRGYFHD
ncbi:MAG: precorrin-3B C(17)-methyltransferase [Clostridiales bacterium]